MKKALRPFLLASLLLSTASLFAQELDRSIRIELFPNDKSLIQDLLLSDLDVTHIHGDHLDLLVSDTELKELKSLNAEIEIINPNVYAGPRGGGFLPEYLSFSEVETQLNDLASTYPALTDLSVIGTSIEGRNIYALKISDNAISDEDEAEVLFIGNHHAREVITPILCMHIAEELLSGYGNNPTYTDWVDNREIWIVPVMNPDGFVYVETNNLFWRKNRRNNPGNQEGVDLNRNWGFEWGHDNNGSSPNFGSSTYRGTGPFSEPETDVMQQFVNNHDFEVALSYHSFGNLFLWGPGYKPGDSVDQDIYAGFGEVVTAQNGYTIGNPATGAIYQTNGDATDWLYNVKGIIAFTPEVGNSNDYFNPPAKRIPTLIEQGAVCAWEVLRYAGRPGQLAPPGQPQLNTISPTGGDYLVSWTEPIEADTEPVAYELVEKMGPNIITDGGEKGSENFALNGWTLSSERNNGGSFSFYGGAEHELNRVCFASEGYLVQPGDAFSFDAWFDIESDYDYAYAVVSTDGGRSYQPLAGSFTTMSDPNGRNADHGITGNSGGWQSMSFDLDAYAGQTVWLGFRYSTDGGALGDGIWIDNVQPVQTWAKTSMLSNDISGLEYEIVDQPAGTYHYTIRGLDAEGDWGYPSENVAVTITEQFVVEATSFEVTRGRFGSGDASSTHDSDNSDLVAFRSPSDIQSRTELEVASTSPFAVPSTMKIVLESSVFARSSIQQTLELYNFDTNAWEVIDVRDASRMNDSMITVDVTGTIGRFVEPGSLVVKARVRYESAIARQTFSSAVDQFIWILEE